MRRGSITEKEKSWIDGADYETLFRRWRHGPLGDEIFTGEAGIYYANKLKEKLDQLSDEDRAYLSRTIGWF